MNIYRSQKNNKLYKIEQVSPFQILGHYYDATPLYNNNAQQFNKMTEKYKNQWFKKVSYSNKISDKPTV